jgi:short subunit dehydrogenase-like uncharacterized protein
MDRDFDLVLQGATGFTGRLAAAELERAAPAGLRWAVAGRDLERVTEVAAAHDVPAVVANGLDPTAMDALAARARVVLSCAGPFAAYGTPLVAACARHGTHYADLTGELPWIRELIGQWHASCARSGTALLPACGFDAVPSDLAMHELRRRAQAHGLPSGPACGFWRIRGGMNGGTLASGLHLYARWKPEDFAHPYLLDPDPAESLRARGPPCATYPTFAVPALHRWAAPFVMAGVNERVVRRSVALLAAEGDSTAAAFPYREFRATRSRGAALIARAELALAEILLRRRAGRALLRQIGPKPGAGPSEADRRAGFAHLDLLLGDLSRPVLHLSHRWDGDPSNTITVRCLVYAGLELAERGPRRGGVLTPAVALGERLFTRLRAAGAVHAAPRS